MTQLDAAQWMLSMYQRARYLDQSTAFAYLMRERDESLTYYDANGNGCINKQVLNIFRRLTPDSVYERGSKVWRARAPYDRPGRLQ